MMHGGGGGDRRGGRENEGLGWLTQMMMPLPLQLNSAVISALAGGDDDYFLRRDKRVPQWSHQETRDFIAIRAQLERDYTIAKQNKTLWEVVSSRMRELGYRRS